MFKKSVLFALSIILFNVLVIMSVTLTHARASVIADDAVVRIESSEDRALIESLAQTISACVEQPYGIRSQNHSLTYGPLRSRCDEVEVSGDQVVVEYRGRRYTLVVRESELSDGGDLNDLYIQFDSREDQEALIAESVLSFNDPVLSLLLVTGHEAESLPKVLEPSLSR